MCNSVWLTAAICLMSVHFANADEAMRTSAGKPNVVIIFADDQGYGDLGCFGSKIETPNIDKMAKEGRRFTSFYVSQAVCSASRSSLLTGCYSNRIGIMGALGPGASHGINPTR